MMANIFFWIRQTLAITSCNHKVTKGRFSPGNWCSDLSNLFSNDRKPTQRDCNRSQTDWQRIAV